MSAVAVVMGAGGCVDVRQVRVMVLVGAGSSRARCWLPRARRVSASVVWA
ncbi:hypothetical protein [Streptomyces sp. NPDC093261]